MSQTSSLTRALDRAQELKALQDSFYARKAAEKFGDGAFAALTTALAFLGTFGFYIDIATANARIAWHYAQQVTR